MYKDPEKQKANRLAWEQANPQKVIDGNKRAYQKRLDKCSKE